jgi:hypothetical protein
MNALDVGTMHVCLVCHAEPDIWDGGFYSADHFVRPFLDRLGGVRDHAGRSPSVAWCLTAQMIRHRAAVFRELFDEGHEVGVHSHYPLATTGSLEHSQELNRRHLDDFARWFPDLCALATDSGLPQPQVHASWMFAFRDHMTQALADSGIGIDCSVCFGGAHFLPNGLLLADSRRRESGSPYRLSINDHCLDGTSAVIELPVSGGLEDYWEPTAAGGFGFFYPTASDDDARRQLGLLRDRLDALASGEVDIFHVHFHLYGFGSPNRSPHERMTRATAILQEMASDRRVRFSTPSKSVAGWQAWEGGMRA